MLPLDPKSGWKTTEFWGMLFKLAASLLAMFGFISVDNTQDFSSVAMNAAVALGVVFANMKVAAGYIKSRQDIKVAHSAAVTAAAALAATTPAPALLMGAKPAADQNHCVCQCPCHKTTE
jgi:Kef-type K+ transport system membrane component KefB